MPFECLLLLVDLFQ